MRRLALAFLLTCACSAPTVPGGTTPSPPEPTSECHFDSDCPGSETCQFGTCETIPAKDECHFDSDCLGGSCRMGTCSPVPPDPGP